MTTKLITDNELQKAAALVRCSMLDDLPDEPTGEFSERFEGRISELWVLNKKQTQHHQHRKRLAIATAAILLAVTMLFSFNTEVRAAVINWFKEVFPTYTTYWFTGEKENNLPVFELSEIPEGFVCIFDETSIHSRDLIYKNQDNPTEMFSIRYSILQPGAPLSVSFPDTDYDVSRITVDGHSADLYISLKPEESHALVWADETNGVVFTITVLGDSEVMLHIASLLVLVK